MPDSSSDLQDVAFYYPGHLWRSSEWIKTLILFFDGVALLVPEYKLGEPELEDPLVAAPLRERGLLHYLVADQVVDKHVTLSLAKGLGNLITSGAFKSLAKDGSAFHEISMSRMGFAGDRKLAEMLFEELQSCGLARKSKDGVSIPLHPAIRYAILVLLAQILRPRGPAMGFDLSPATDRGDVVHALTELLNVPESFSAGHVITFDLQNISVDLSHVPLDEVLSFRQDHREEHRRYVRSLRMFARELSVLPEGERASAYRDRQAELNDLANDVKRATRRAWKVRTSFALGLAGATWTLATGDPIGALLTTAALIDKDVRPASREAGAYSYLFATHTKYA